MRKHLQIGMVLVSLAFCAVLAHGQKKTVNYVDELAKVTPAPLPQTPVVPRRGSDASDEYLKGPVKTLREESQALDNPLTRSDRWLVRVREFDRDGNEISAIVYNRGNPWYAIAFGYLDGKRVSKVGPAVHHSYDDRSTTDLFAKLYNPPTKGDARYTWAWEYTYDQQGRLIKKLVYTNDGKLNLRTTYTYSGNKRTTDICSMPCRYTSDNWTDTMDADGRVLKGQLASRDRPNEPTGWMYYKYLEFDKQGNWTKLEISGTVASPNGETVPTHFIQYRTITYF
jgi:YD repeat-containing protein